MNFAWYCGVWLLIVITLILLGYALANQWYYNQMVIYPVPRCYNDWKCRQAVNGQIQEVNMSEQILFGSNSIVHRCSPLTAEKMCSFPYVDQNGVQQIGQPAKEINTWSTTCEAAAAKGDYSSCPFYKPGDIYWRACYATYNYGNNSTYYNLQRTYYTTTKNNPNWTCPS